MKDYRLSPEDAKIVKEYLKRKKRSSLLAVVISYHRSTSRRGSSSTDLCDTVPEDPAAHPLRTDILPYGISVVKKIL